MYQGKFASKDKKGNIPQHTEQLPRNPQPVHRPVNRMPLEDPTRPMPQRPADRKPLEDPTRPMPQRPADRKPLEDPTRPMPQRPVNRKPQENPARPVPQRPVNRTPAPRKPEEERQETDFRSAAVQQPVQPAPKKRHYGGLIFYILFFTVILAIYSFTFFKLGDLQDWLVRYEAAQPTKKYQEIFTTYFEHPNWGLLYDNANIPESQYEGKEAFVAYMEEKVGNTPLTGLETSAGLSKNKKYIIRLGDEKIASFTLVDQNHATEVTDIPDWQLGDIELFFERTGTYYVTAAQGQQVQVNGVPLDDSHVIRVATTRANEYLPEGITAPYTAVHEINELMAKPVVTVLDAAGNQLETSYDEATRTFTTAAAQGEEIPEELKEKALSAIKTYAMYMSVKGGMEEQLADYFQRGTDLFKTFTSMERTWNQRYKDHSFSDDKVKDYVRYTDEMFSARVSTSLHLERSDGSEKVTLLDQSMFFKKVQGKWKCFEMTAVDVSEPLETVRLTFKNGTEVLKSDMLDATLKTVECPAVEAPAGKTFLGWVVEERNEKGERVMRLMLEPDENNIANAPADGLKPMVLMPLFE